MAEDIIKVQDHFYILASARQRETRQRVLKHGDTFAVFDCHGDIEPYGLADQGIYHDGTRHLSRCELRLQGRRPLLLNSNLGSGNGLHTVDLTNPDIMRDDAIVLAHGTVHLLRARFLWRGACYERLQLSNFGLAPLDLSLEIHFDADFADIFEVRGLPRQRRGRRLDPEIDGSSVALPYAGLDGVLRTTRIECAPTPSAIGARVVRFDLHLPPRQEKTVALTVRCEPCSGPRGAASFDAAFAESAAGATLLRGDHRVITSGNAAFNDWLERSRADLEMMITETPSGPYPYAGIPWFSAPFGRDGIITALETLWLHPELAKGVLAFLAATQADADDPERDAEPGKILHEARRGEMAALGEVPFGRYYGSVDATPLFIVLAEAYHRRTGDLDFIDRLWPHVGRALEWVVRRGDLDGDGFVEYRRRNPRGLVNQGWKDSHDAVMHADGTPAEGPIALCEVQGYAYAARLAAADLAAVREETGLARELRREARALKERFAESFWQPDLGTYALALDGEKRPCRVRASNAGHCLFTGIVPRAHALRLARTLMTESSFSGWGVRTLDAREARCNPMSYHNGSVWPHDNALIAAGLARYGLKEDTSAIFGALFDASVHLDLHRMPELFCGMPRRRDEGPTLYPVACAPQAWAAGAVYLLVQACLGLTVDGVRREVRFEAPRLPEALGSLRISGLRVGDGVVDVLVQAFPHDVGITVKRREGDVKIVVVK